MVPASLVLVPHRGRVGVISEKSQGNRIGRIVSREGRKTVGSEKKKQSVTAQESRDTAFRKATVASTRVSPSSCGILARTIERGSRGTPRLRHKLYLLLGCRQHSSSWSNHLSAQLRPVRSLSHHGEPGDRGEEV